MVRPAAFRQGGALPLYALGLMAFSCIYLSVRFIFFLMLDWQYRDVKLNTPSCCCTTRRAADIIIGECMPYG